MEHVVVDGRVVTIRYELRNQAGEVLHACNGEPCLGPFGTTSVAPGLVTALAQCHRGDELEVEVRAADGYGDLVAPTVKTLPRHAFPPGLDVRVGMGFTSQDANGNPVRFWVQRVTNDAVRLENNHPLAGLTLHYRVRVHDVRDATDAERSRGVPQATRPG